MTATIKHRDVIYLFTDMTATKNTGMHFIYWYDCNNNTQEYLPTSMIVTITYGDANYLLV